MPPGDLQNEKSASPGEGGRQRPGIGWAVLSVLVAMLGCAAGAVLGDYAYLVGHPRPANLAAYRAAQTGAALLGVAVAGIGMTFSARSSRSCRILVALGMTTGLVLLLALGIYLVGQQVASAVEPAPTVESFDIPDHLFSDKPRQVPSTTAGRP